MSDASASSPPAAPILRTALHALHLEYGARMVPFAGYDMPVQYPLGVLKEHLHTRTAAGLFDVSHMGQLKLLGSGADAALETLVPVDLLSLLPGQQRYAMFTNDQGGLRDDLMVTRCPAADADDLYVVVNAGCKIEDTAHLRQHIGARTRIVELSEHALLALQGPMAADVMRRLVPAIDLSGWIFMTGRNIVIDGISCFATRSGYTGEDGFEISVANADAERLARLLLADQRVAWVGLGARDSLRLEAGLCLYGHDIDATTTPVEASLAWALSKARRADGARPGAYPGAARVLQQLANGVAKKRVGLVGIERTPVREGAELFDQSGTPIGRVTSGGVGPSLGAPMALAYVSTAHSAPGTEIIAQVRGKAVPMRVTKTPFVPQRYFRG